VEIGKHFTKVENNFSKKMGKKLYEAWEHAIKNIELSEMPRFLKDSSNVNY